MRKAEWIQLVFVLLVVAGAWLCDLPPVRRLKILSQAGGAIAAILLARSTLHYLRLPVSAAIRDWLPAALLLVPYWQIGQFFTSPNVRLQDKLVAFDRTLIGRMRARRRQWPIIDLYFELVYLLVYPLIPGGLAVLYGGSAPVCRPLLDGRFVCDLRLLGGHPLRPCATTSHVARCHNPVRALNRWVLQRAGIQTITFPSAHVAASFAASLVLLELLPSVELVFAWLALSIALATVLGGYHHIADVLLGLAVSILIFVGVH